ncbi:MAG TPA: hypothetical protein VGF48_10270 [Thermoanaerobaculia bacterium]|jgi:hypothetical protein
MKTTITVQRVTAKEIEVYFSLDSPGYFLARDAERAGEIASAADAVEVITLINKFYQVIMRDRIVKELSERHGKPAARKYLESWNTDDGSDFALDTLGKDLMKIILRETMDEVKRESGVGSGKNDPTKAAKRAAKKRRPQSL